MSYLFKPIEEDGKIVLHLEDRISPKLLQAIILIFLSTPPSSLKQWKEEGYSNIVADIEGNSPLQWTTIDEILGLKKLIFTKLATNNWAVNKDFHTIPNELKQNNNIQLPSPDKKVQYIIK